MSAAPGLDDASPRLTDLLSDCARLLDLTRVQLAQRRWLDAYLLAVGANQIVEDYLHPEPFNAHRLAGRIEARGRVGSAARAGLLGAGRAWFLLGLQRRRQWHWWQRAWAQEVVIPLAGQVATPADDGTAALGETNETAVILAAQAQAAPAALRHALVRLPSCFHSFDQQPEDVRRLVERFAARWPDRTRPLVVVGVRSSGGYLSPLARVFLEAMGYMNVVDLTLRPGRWLHPDETMLLRRGARQGGLALVLDDPPASGRALDQVGVALQSVGFAPDDIVLLVAVFESVPELPPTLQRYQQVVLAWPNWAIHSQMASARMHSTLMDLLRERGEVLTVTRLPLAPRTWARGHAQARYAVELRLTSAAAVEQIDVYAEGVGLGYFGAHALAVADRLPEYVPRIYGLRAGVLVREWLPASARIGAADRAPAVDRQSVAEGISGYVAERRRLMPLATDKSAALRGQDPVWELAGYIVERSFGNRAARPLRPLVQAAVRALLKPSRPAVVDGATGLDRWFLADTPDRLRKIGFAERDFSNLDGFCCDPVYDVAGAAVLAPDRELVVALRHAYERRAGEQIDPERWLLYRLVQAQLRLRIQTDDSVGVQKDNARALRDYFGETVLADSVAPGEGPVCAIDVDGVLESEELGFPGLTPGAALGLRALSRHGYRPVVVTGRALAEVRERCRAYGLAGGVAEYGAVIYDHHRQHATDLLSEAARSDLERVRSALRREAGVIVDADYEHAVRAYRLATGFKRRALAPDVVIAVLAEAGTDDRVRAIPGESQTDFMFVGIDKGNGLQALLQQFRKVLPDSTLRVAMAIGDSVSDLPMLALAERSFAPANADARVRDAGISITRSSFQLGLLEAIGSLLGHPPGTCGVCRAPALSDRTRLLNAILSAADRPRSGKLVAAADLAWRLAVQARRR